MWDNEEDAINPHISDRERSEPLSSSDNNGYGDEDLMERRRNSAPLSGYSPTLNGLRSLFIRAFLRSRFKQADALPSKERLDLIATLSTLWSTYLSSWNLSMNHAKWAHCI